MTVDLVLGFYTRARLFLMPRRPSPTFYILIPPGRCRCFVTSFLSRALLLQRAKAAVIDKAWAYRDRNLRLRRPNRHIGGYPVGTSVPWRQVASAGSEVRCQCMSLRLDAWARDC